MHIMLTHSSISNSQGSREHFNRVDRQNCTSFFPLGNVPKVMTLQRTTAVIQFKIANKRFESNARTDKNGIRSTRFVCVFHSFHLSSFLLHFRSTWFVVEYKIRATNPCLNGNRRSKLQTEYEFKQTQQQVYRQ